MIDHQHQVEATFDADSGIVEVFPYDKERTGLMLGVRPDVGHGAFVRVTADQAERVAAKLLRPRPPFAEYLMLDNQQAAALFRLCISNGLQGCQYEGEAMRWWLPQGLRLELAEGQWRLYVVPTRDAFACSQQRGDEA